MRPEHVYAVYYSAVGGTKKVCQTIGQALAERFEAPFTEISFTLPKEREQTYTFGPGDLVVFGTPTYAGRIPNKMLPFVQTLFQGNDALAIPVAAFGNRSYQDALSELRTELEQHGFHTVAGAGVVCRHVFAPDELAPGRPDEKDLQDLRAFAGRAADKILALTAFPEPVKVGGNDPVGPYYTPLGIDGKPAKFLKAKPKVNEELCDNCGICAAVCPLGSISAEDVKVVDGVCIKCQACVRKCPKGARYFDDPALASHIEMLKENYSRRAESEFFL